MTLEKTYYDVFNFYGRETFMAFEAYDHKGFWQIILS
jgi:hypothetical protein